MNELNVITEPGKSLVHKITYSPVDNMIATTGTSVMNFDEVTHLLSNKPLRGVDLAQFHDTSEETEADIAAARVALAGSPQCIPYTEARRQLGLE